MMKKNTMNPNELNDDFLDGTDLNQAEVVESLRKRAEKLAVGKKIPTPDDLLVLSSDESKRLIHELSVHQIELELQNEALRASQNALEAARARYFDIYELAPVAYIIISESGIIMEANLTAAMLLGVDKSQLINRPFSQWIVKEDQDIFYLSSKKIFASCEPQVYEMRMQKSDGNRFWVHLMAAFGQDEQGNSICRITMNDLTEQKNVEYALKKSEQKYKALFSSMSEGIALCKVLSNRSGKPIDYIFVDINDSYIKLTGITREQAIGKRLTEVAPEMSRFIAFFGNVALTGEPNSQEIYYEKTGKYYSIYAYCPEINYFAVLVSDITQRISYENRLKYLSYHDMLTGLFNRRFLEEEIRRMDTSRNLPISIIMGDLNRLKLVNDAFGHEKGDEFIIKVADAMKASCRPEELIARWGGDEFMIFLPKTNEEEAKRIIDRIQQHCAKENVNSIELSISFGLCVKTSADQNIVDVMRESENDMYRSKARENERSRNDIINAVIDALFKKDPVEEKHARRVCTLCKKTAEALGCSEEEIRRMALAGLMHDIGKVAISVLVLEKSTPLTDEEWKEIRKHSTTGYKVVGSAKDMMDIGNAILSHHEREDGKGYPRGINSKEVPLAAKVIAIADSFDAMTNQTAYRNKMGINEAIEEIRRNEGSQFDTEIAELFIEKVLRGGRKNKK